MISSRSKAGFEGEGAGRCASPRRWLCTSSEIFIASLKLSHQDNYTSLIKNSTKCRHNYIKDIKVRYFFYFYSLSTGRIIVSPPLKIFLPPLTFSKIRPCLEVTFRVLVVQLEIWTKALVVHHLLPDEGPSLETSNFAYIFSSDERSYAFVNNDFPRCSSKWLHVRFFFFTFAWYLPSRGDNSRRSQYETKWKWNRFKPIRTISREFCFQSNQCSSGGQWPSTAT